MPHSNVSITDRRLAVTVGRNTIFVVASNAAQILSRFVMVPIVIAHLGLGGYGIWNIVMVTAGYMRFGRYGLKSAFQKYVAEATGNGDYDTASKLLSTGAISMLLLSAACLLPVAIFSKWLAAISGVPLGFLHEAADAITLLALIMVASNFGAAFEAIVMGGHRIDLTAKFSTVSMVGEAVSIIVLLHFGFGLFAMAIAIAVSEVLYVLYCYYSSRRVLPEISVSTRYMTGAVLPELVRFAGSYQLVNLLEVLYAMLLPVTILKYFGAEVAGLYAVATRLVAAALIGQDALTLPILSAGTMMFASASSGRLLRFFKKSFKANLAVTIAPLAFLAAFGPLVILGWIGQRGSGFQVTIWLCCMAALFQAVSRLQLILYRASGKALHDNLRQGFRLGVLLMLATVGGTLGFYGVLTGLAIAEVAGVVYMFFAMTRELRDFSASALIPDTVRLSMATVLMIGAGLLTTVFHVPYPAASRESAIAKLAAVCFGCLLAALPAIALTGSVSSDEKRAIVDLFVPGRGAAAAVQD
jgi:O-antigen/teichoic acid export membrane protein